MLDNDGYCHIIGNESWKLNKESLAMAQGKLCFLLHKTHMNVCGGQLNAVKDDTSLDLWQTWLVNMSN